MSNKSESKGEQYLKEKAKTKKKSAGMSKNDKSILIIMIAVITVLTVCVVLLLSWFLNGSLFKDKAALSGSATAGSSDEWTDIEIKSPEDAEDGRKQKKGVYTFVCCGIDIDEYRADTIMLVTLDTNTKTANVMHILRDTFITTGGRDYKINSFYARKKSDGIRQIIYNTMGIYPNYYVTLNFAAFKNIVDIIGGVEVDVPFDMKYSDPTQDLYIDLKAGLQTLNGDQAEQYVRYRKGSGGDGSDESRQKRQEQFLKAFMEQASKTSAGNIVSVVSQMITHMNTNMSISELSQFAHDGIELGIENVHFYTLPGDYEFANHLWYYSAYEKQTLEMLNEYFNPYEEELTEKWVNFDAPVDKTDKDEDEEESSSSKSVSSSSSKSSSSESLSDSKVTDSSDSEESSSSSDDESSSESE